MGDTQLVTIPAMENVGRENGEEKMILKNSETLINPPLKLEILCIVSKATKHFSDAEPNDPQATLC